MSHNYPYRTSSDSFRPQASHLDSYKSQTDVYRPPVTSHNQDSSFSAASSSRSKEPLVVMPGNAQSFLHSCGLDTDDLALLAELPEHLISVETLPKLLLQIKERKLSGVSSSSRPFATQPRNDTSSHARESSSSTEIVQYPINLPSRPVYPLPPEQVQNWQDRWGNPRQSDSAKSVSTGSKSDIVLNYSKAEDPYYGEKTCASAAAASSTASRSSHTDYSRTARQSIEPSNTIMAGPVFHVPTRKEASDFHGKVPPVFPYACILCDITVLSEKDWSLHVNGPQHANSQFHLVEKYPKWDLQLESAKRHELHALPHPKFGQKTGGATKEKTPGWTTRHDVNTKDVKLPTRKEASDFHSRFPPVFPYACVLCDVTVHSETDWRLHINGSLHANSQYRLVEKYPEWDQRIDSVRRFESSQSSSTKTREKKERKKDRTSDRKKRKTSPEKNKVKVVCIKFTANSLEEGYLKQLLGQFGAIEKVVMFHTLALVEMGTYDQSADVVKYFTANPLELNGNQIKFSFGLPQSSSIVSFAPLPAGEGISSELKAIAKRFGSVRNSMFLPNRGYVEMTDSAEAKKLVEHYSDNPLKLKGKIVQVSFSTEHSIFKKPDDCEEPPARSDSRRKSDSGRSSSQRGSPSPKRRCSSEKRHSSRSRSSKERDDAQQSKENSSTSSKRSSHSSPCSPKKKNTKLNENAVEKTTVSVDIVAAVESDSDLEGLEVIADDGEELFNFDDENECTTEIQQAQQENKTFEENAEITSVDTVEEKPSNGQDNFQSDTVNIPSVNSNTQIKASEDATNVNSPETPHFLTKEQVLEEQNHQMQESEMDADFPDNIENCVTLDEIIDDELSGNQDDEPKSSAEKTEDKPEEVTKTTDHPVPTSDVDFEQSQIQSDCPRQESASMMGAEPESSEEELREIKNSVDQTTEKQDTEKVADDIKVDQEVFGKVISVRNLPRAEDYTDQHFVNLAKRYGEVKHYLLSRSYKKGFVEMVHSCDAERIAADSKNKDLVLRGSLLKVEVSEKYSSLPTEGVTVLSDSDDEESRETEKTTENNSNDDVTSNGNTEPVCTSDVVTESMTETSDDPHNRNEPLGTEFVRPVVGYFCNLCNAIYASEEEAKDEHCRTPSHHEKVKEHMEKKKIGS